MQVKGVVLKAIPYRETSKIIHLLTRELGKISVMIRGAYRSNNRMGLITEVFSMGTFYVSEGQGDFYYLNEVDLYSTNYGMRMDYRRLLVASYMMEVIEKTSHSALIDEKVFDMVVVALADLAEREGNFEAFLVAFMLKWATLTGYRPELFYCAICGDDEGHVAGFSIEAGGLVCRNCRQRTPLHRVDKAMVDAMKFLLYRPFRQVDDVDWDEFMLKAMYQMLESYILYHTDQRRLTTSRMLKDLWTKE